MVDEKASVRITRRVSAFCLSNIRLVKRAYVEFHCLSRVHVLYLLSTGST